MTTAALGSGFADPVFDGQRVFRAVLSALSEPGRVVPLGLAGFAPPAPLPAEVAAVALALIDHETPVWLDAVLQVAPVVAWLKFHTGARMVKDPSQAAFALIGAPAAMPPLDAFAQGTLDYPDRSTTLVLAVDALDNPVAGGLVLAGPGIAGERQFACAPQPEGFAGMLAANRARFPCGVDLVLAGGGAVAGLPRTTRVSGGPSPCMSR
jgi:alpha-D-ribose 1-methylphosphonate 5-triphosphate synthase subunit PhnH